MNADGIDGKNGKNVGLGKAGWSGVERACGKLGGEKLQDRPDRPVLVLPQFAHRRLPISGDAPFPQRPRFRAVQSGDEFIAPNKTRPNYEIATAGRNALRRAASQ